LEAGIREHSRLMVQTIAAGAGAARWGERADLDIGGCNLAAPAPQPA
jgi:hypothetical protein